MVESHRRTLEQRNEDIADLASLITIGYHNPKEFSKDIKRFRRIKQSSAGERQQIKQEASAHGIRVPV